MNTPPPDVLAAWQAARLAAYDEQVPARYAQPIPLPGAVHAWVQQLVDGKPASNLLLVGPVGTGKTHVAIHAGRAVAEHLPRPVLVITGPRFNQLVRPGQGYDPSRAIGDMQTCGLLLLDDIGAAGVTPWIAEALFAVINDRYAWCRPTIVTSNHADLRQLLGEQVASRLAQDAVLVTMTGPDHRRSGA